MARFCVLVFSLLAALWTTQQVRGRLIQLTDLHSKSTNIVDLSFEHESFERHGTLEHQLLKRQTSGEPSTDGVHEFHDGYYRARIYYPGGGSEVILVLTYDWRNNIAYRSNLYRSSNYGSTFTNISSSVNNITLYQRFYTNGSTVIFVGASLPQLFYTIDEGANFTRIDLVPNTLVTTTVVYHPTRDGWMMMKDQSHSLYVTEDFGRTWKNISANVDTSRWADGDWDEDDRMIYFNSSSSRLYISDYPYSGGAKEFDSNLGVHDGFEIVGRYIFVQGTDSGMVALYVSDRRGPFQKAYIPIPGGHERYLVSHIDDMQALVVVEHAEGYYNLYLSDESGLFFSLSLRDIVVETLYRRWQIDLELIRGVNGTLIANQYAREGRTSRKRTVISYDNGAFWSGLLPPDENVDGTAINCEPPDCSLHLQMDTSYYARLGVYSTESAPGIIVAHGNTGTTLSGSPDLYISRDGGVTWEQTLTGSWGVNLADHGGLMVAAKDYHQEASMVLKYSCNEGYSWNNFQFINHTITVFGVITEPGHHTTVASLYGGPWGTGAPFEWIVVTVDFAGIFSRDCVDRDYYDWRPWDVRSESSCILGSSITIERRMPQTCCRNGREYDREFDFQVCGCTSEDYECDYGYARADFNSPCLRDNITILPDPCSDRQTKTYKASTGYRKIGGDVCAGGEESIYQPYMAECCRNIIPPPSTTTSTSTTSTSSSTATTTSSSTSSSATTSTSSSSSTTSSSTSSSATTTKTTKTSTASSTPTPASTTTVMSTSSTTITSTTTASTSSSTTTASTTSSSGSTRSSTSGAGTTSTTRGGPVVQSRVTRESEGKVMVLGVLLGVTLLTTAIFLVLFSLVSIKYRKVKQKYIRVLTAAEPDLQTLKNAEDDDSPQTLDPAGDDDDDEKPLLM